MSQIPDMEIVPARRSFWRNLSPVWLVPVLALAVSAAIAWRSYAERGVLVQITFQNAAGISPGETAVRFRDVPIGFVESVSFTPDLAEVVVAARIDRAVAEVLPPEAEFWVVRPEVSARGISGLTTVLSGVYLEAAFAPTQGAGARAFAGRESAPLVLPGRPGTRITLRAPDGNRLSPGAPVLHRGIEVGHIESPRLLDGAEGVVFDAFIEAPHDQRLTTATRFWDTSGFSFSLGPGGVRLSVGNLASILTGGIAFDTILSGGEPVGPDTVFDLFADEPAARQTLTAGGASANALRLAVEFDESVQGLAAGAAVRYRGVQVGEVAGIAARIVDLGPAPRVRMQAVMALDPRSFGLQADAGPEVLETFIEGQVAAGLRARMAPSGLFSTSLVIELVDLPETAPDTLLRPEGSLPVIPSAPSDLQDLTTSAQGLIDRLTSLPIEQVLDQAVALMASVEVLLADEGTRAAPAAVVALIDEARALIGGEAVQALPAEVQGVVAELRTILAAFTEQRAAERLVQTLESAQAVADDLARASADVPALVADLRALVARAAELEAEALVAAATTLLQSADAFVNAEGTQALPPALAGALDEVQAALAELRAGGVVANVNATLASASTAAEAVATASRDLPALAARFDALVTQAEALIAAYGARSPVNDEMLGTLREARAAARAFAQLARTLERSPNSILFGR